MEKLIRLRRLALVFLLALPASSSMTIWVTAPPELADRTLLNLQVYYHPCKKISAGGGENALTQPPPPPPKEKKWRAGWGENANALPRNPSAMAGGRVG